MISIDLLLKTVFPNIQLTHKIQLNEFPNEIHAQTNKKARPVFTH
jgi:hypothetical protein